MRTLPGNPHRLSVFCASLFLLAGAGRATTITMTDSFDGPGAFQVDPASQAGMSNWTPNGNPNIMPQQWFWFRTGTTGFYQNALQSLDTLSAPTIAPSIFPNSADIQYSNSVLAVDLGLQLVDGEPASVLEAVKWTNLSASTLYLTIFQYVHFQFSSNSDSLSISSNDAQQSGANGSSEVTVDPFVSGFFGSEAATYSTLLDALTNASTSSSFDVNHQSSASGNVETAFEWQVQLSPSGTGGSSYTLSINENASSIATPEPASGILLIAGGLGLCALRRYTRFLPRG